MSKRELIDYICKINRSAKPEFLASFSEEELNAYLEHLMELDLEELAGSGQPSSLQCISGSSFESIIRGPSL